MSKAHNTRARPANRPSLRTLVTLVLAVLVLFGLAASGLGLPERADARPLTMPDLRAAAAPGSAALDQAITALPQRPIRIATALPLAAVPVSQDQHPAHQDADLRRSHQRRPIVIRGPPAGHLA